MKHNLFLKPLNALSRKLTVASVSVGIFLKKEEEEKKVLLGLFRQLPQLPLSSCACPNIWKAAAEVKLPPLRFLFYFFLLLNETFGPSSLFLLFSSFFCFRTQVRALRRCEIICHSIFFLLLPGSNAAELPPSLRFSEKELVHSILVGLRFFSLKDFFVAVECFRQPLTKMLGCKDLLKR